MGSNSSFVVRDTDHREVTGCEVSGQGSSPSETRRFGRIVAAALVLCLALGVVSTAAPDAGAATCGAVLVSGASWGGVDVKSNGANSGTANSCAGLGTYGYQYQCPELVNRLYRTKGWMSSTWSGNGHQMYATAPANLTKQPQGSVTHVAVGDVVVFNTSFFSGYGHVAVVGSVSGSGGVLYSQNTSSHAWSFTLSGGTLTVPGVASAGQITGVVHRPGGSPPSPSGPAENTQMIANAGFESGLTSWERLNLTANTNRAIYTNAGNAHTGSKYLEANTTKSGGSMGQDLSVPVKAGKFYRLRIWAWSAQPATVKAQVWALGGTNESASTTVAITNRWTPIDVVLKPARAHTTLRAELYMLTTGVNYRFDSTELKWHNSKPSTLSYQPIGKADSLGSRSSGTVRAAGWAIDNSAPTSPVNVRIYIGGPMGSAAAEVRSPGTAAGRRDDLNAKYPWAGPNHGFDYTVATTKTGAQPVYVYGMNIGGGSGHTLLGSGVVNIVK